MRPANAGVSVGLAMIVKDEAPRLARLARSLDGQLDHWTIVDTGSSDETVQVARRQFQGVPGSVIEDTWRGYGPSRNVALAEARRHTDFVLTLDADDTFHGTIDRAVPPDCDGVEAEYHVGELRYWVPRLIRSVQPWEWRGRAHEYLTTVSGAFSLGRTGSFHVLHHADGGNRATKFQREVDLLLADMEEDPDDPRPVFYLGRNHDDVGDLARATRYYRARLRMGGWDEETWYAQWRLGCCLLATGWVDEGCGMLWRAWDSRPLRAEPLCTLAEHYRRTSQWRLSFEACELARKHCDVGRDIPHVAGDRLFVHLDVYQWRIAYEQSICAFYVGQPELGRTLTDELLSRQDLPADVVATLEGNRAFYAGV
jgi:glycosyltransferase involved in cell wall biosynthesis